MKLRNAEEIVHCMDACKFVSFKVFDPEGKIHSVMSYNRDENDKIHFELDNGGTYLYNDLGYYDPLIDGAVTAIRIANRDGHQPIATLTFAFGGSFSFEWDRLDLREFFSKGITAYTFFYDTRAMTSFKSWVKDSEERAWPDIISTK